MSNPGAQLCGRFAMAEQAEGTNIIEIALPAALSDRNDMVGIPKTATTGDGLHAIEAKAGSANSASCAFQGRVRSHGIDSACGAPTPVASEHLITKVSGIGSEAPLVHAIVAAEGSAALRNNLKITPAAERKAAGAKGKIAAAGATAGKCAGGNFHTAQKIKSEFEIDLNRFNKWHQPSQELLVDRMVVVSIERGTVGKFHDSTKGIPLRTRREVMSDIDLEQTGNLPRKRPNLFEGTLFLRGCNLRFPTEEKGVNDHELSLI